MSTSDQTAQCKGVHHVTKRIKGERKDISAEVFRLFLFLLMTLVFTSSPY